MVGRLEGDGRVVLLEAEQALAVDGQAARRHASSPSVPCRCELTGARRTTRQVLGGRQRTPAPS
eukprot:scaffold18473_cov54-Phaeocystis_antarctica.AAC.2